MYLTLLTDISYKSQFMHHTVQIFGNTVTVIHEQNNKLHAECTVESNFVVTLDGEGATVYFESEDDFVKLVTMLNEFSGEDE